MPENDNVHPVPTYEEAFAQAMEIACAQAGVKVMAPEDVLAYAKDVAKGILGTVQDSESVRQKPALDPAKSIGEKAITCLECGRKFRMMTSRHLQTHGLDADAYREKWGLKKGTALSCKALTRIRRQKMESMQIWTHRQAVQKDGD